MYMKKAAIVIVILNLIVAAAFAQDSLFKKSIKSKVANGAVMASDKNIIQNVSKAKDYSILLNAIKVSGLDETFESKGPLTIFAPTNSAFAKLPGGKMDSLLKPEHKYELSSLIAYHAIAGKVSAKDISHNIKEHKGIAIYTTLAGSKITATIDTNRNIILTDENGGQCVISQFDVEQSNGMLHVVNTVFIPKTKVI
jgi:uncharacterized surface protein with fasciclin (FAS1) repeats